MRSYLCASGEGSGWLLHSLSLAERDETILTDIDQFLSFSVSRVNLCRQWTQPHLWTPRLPSPKNVTVGGRGIDLLQYNLHTNFEVIGWWLSRLISFKQLALSMNLALHRWPCYHHWTQQWVTRSLNASRKKLISIWRFSELEVTPITVVLSIVFTVGILCNGAFIFCLSTSTLNAHRDQRLPHQLAVSDILFQAAVTIDGLHRYLTYGVL